ncbi:MAG: ABC transporter ATP-binding protein/permease [Deltaproteobacteria bacterium]|jgi:ABC-type multidrug transport system fused ATPase/permease subunit|nr:ABC transporter ATP-binding protein/permease [Deltaproteobacteria bacterium]
MLKIISLLSTKKKIQYFFLAILALLGAILVSATPVYLGRTIDGISNQSENWRKLIVIFAIIFASSQIIHRLRGMSVDRVSAAVEEDLRNNTIFKLLRLPLKDLNSSEISGELAAKLEESVEGASKLVKLTSSDLLPSLFIAGCIVLQTINHTSLFLGIVIITYIFITFYISYLQIKSQRGIRVKILNFKTRLNGSICQSIAGIEQIRALGAEDAEFKRLAPQTKKIRLVESQHHTTMAVFDILKLMVKVIFFSGLLFLIYNYVSAGELTEGGALTIVLLFQQLLQPIDEFYRFLDEISECLSKVDILKRIENQDIDFSFKINDNKLIDTSVLMNNYDVQVNECKVYSPDFKTLISECHALSLSTKNSTAIVARTGFGKSTLIKAIIRLYPQEGSIKIFGYDLSMISQRRLTQLLHYIPQQPFFFAGTVRDNLVFGLEPEPADDEICIALENACFLDELNKLAKSVSDPLDYAVEENAKNLSGGQIKRMAFARAFLRHPKLFIFDETFANLDQITVDKLMKNIKRHTAAIGAGTVHISHEPRIINSCEIKMRLDA